MVTSILARNNVTIIGEGDKTIIFGHGFGCDQNMWRLLVPYFQDEYRLILFDYVGSGKSELSAYNLKRYGNLVGYAQDVLEIVDALKLEKPIFIGHSVSSMIGMLASIERPDVFESLVMIGPSSCYLNDLPAYVGGFEKKEIVELLDMMEMNFIGWASYLAPIVVNNPERPGLAKEVATSFSSSDPAITREFAEVTFFSDHREDLEKSDVPTLILQCSDDSIVPIEAGEYLHLNLKNSTFQLMEAKGHYPHLSHPEETVYYIKKFLSSY
ncbi:alpha/beta fold hydrolase [Pseudoneobacillus sp. C159]